MVTRGIIPNLLYKTPWGEKDECAISFSAFIRSRFEIRLGEEGGEEASKGQTGDLKLAGCVGLAGDGA